MITVTVTKTMYVDENGEQPFYHITAGGHDVALFSKLTDDLDEVPIIVNEAVQSLLNENRMVNDEIDCDVDLQQIASLADYVAKNRIAN